MAAMLTISSTSQPRCSTWTGSNAPGVVGKSEGVADASNVRVPRGIGGHGVGSILIRAAEIGSVSQHRVDDEGQGFVVGADFKPNAVVGQQDVAAVDGFAILDLGFWINSVRGPASFVRCN